MTVSHEGDRDSYYREFDKHGRLVYHSNPSGYWAMKFFVDEHHVMTPYFVLHEFSVLYNTLPFYNPNIK